MNIDLIKQLSHYFSHFIEIKGRKVILKGESCKYFLLSHLSQLHLISIDFFDPSMSDTSTFIKLCTAFS
jgi:hypothetical protein